MQGSRGNANRQGESDLKTEMGRDKPLHAFECAQQIAGILFLLARLSDAFCQNTAKKHACVVLSRCRLNRTHSPAGRVRRGLLDMPGVATPLPSHEGHTQPVAE